MQVVNVSASKRYRLQDVSLLLPDIQLLPQSREQKNEL